MSPPDYTEKFEEKGEDAVRAALAKGLYGTRKKEAAQLWLAERDRAAAEARSSMDLRIDLANLKEVKTANRVAIICMILTSINTVISVIIWLS